MLVCTWYLKYSEYSSAYIPATSYEHPASAWVRFRAVGFLLSALFYFRRAQPPVQVCGRRTRPELPAAFFLRVTVPTAHFAGNRRAGIKADFKDGSLGFRTHTYGMQSPGLSDTEDDDGDLSITSWRDNFVIDYGCDLPVPWTVSVQGGCVQVHAGSPCVSELGRSSTYFRRLHRAARTRRRTRRRACCSRQTRATRTRRCTRRRARCSRLTRATRS